MLLSNTMLPAMMSRNSVLDLTIKEHISDLAAQLLRGSKRLTDMIMYMYVHVYTHVLLGEL